MENIYTIRLKISGSTDMAPLFTVMQGDKGTRKITASIIDDNGMAYAPGSGVSARYVSRKSDGTGTEHTTGVTLSGSTVNVVLTEQDLASPGLTYAAIVLFKTNEELTTMPFWFKVVSRPVGDSIRSQNSYEDYDKGLAALRHAPTIDPNTAHWFIWDIENGVYVDTGVVADGGAAGAVSYAQSQSLTDAQKNTARTNINAASPEDVHGYSVSYSDVQTLTDAQKNTARININAASPEDVHEYSVSYSNAQTLTDAQKNTARTNISAASIEDISDIQEALTTKAEIDGVYDLMTVGNAEELVPTEFISEDNTPYKFRRSGGGSIEVGNREFNEIIGGSLVWNQLANNRQTDSTSSGITATKNTDGTWNISGTATGNGGVTFDASFALASNHVYYCKGCPSGGSSTTYFYGIGGTVVDFGNGGIWKNVNSYSSGSGRLIFKNGQTLNFSNLSFMIIDLTAMFGTTIADYIYSLETATTGAGVAWVKKYIDLDTYHEYDAGTIKSVEGLQSHDMVGFNLFDEEWELGRIDTSTGNNVASTTQIRSKNYIPVIPSASYWTRNDGIATIWMAVLAYDANKAFIQNLGSINNNIASFTVPQQCRYIRFYMAPTYGTTYNHDICINLSDPAKNGTYEPYTKHSYPLDSSLTLRGIPQLDANNNLYYDGDIYEADGTVTRKYGVVDLGSRNFVADSAGTGIFRYSDINLGRKYGTVVFSLLCSKYSTYTIEHSTASNIASLRDSNGNGLYVNGGSQIFYICDSAYTDAATFKTAMSGVMLVYELATPTTESARPYSNPQAVDKYGTEEYVMDSPIPVGHVTRYSESLKAKLQALPYKAEKDGLYLIEQVDDHMNLAPADTVVVDTADNLLSDQYTEEQEAYTYRQTGGGHTNGAREADMIVGGSLVWNQLVFIPSSTQSKTENGVTFTDNRDGTYTVVTDSSGATANTILPLYSYFPVINGHKYLFKSSPTGGSYSTYFAYMAGNISFANGYDYGNGNMAIATATGTTSVVAARIQSGMVITSPITFRPQAFDLTAMFGTTMADYAYNLESTTKGAGVAWVGKYIDLDTYNEYDAGSIKSVEGLQSHDTVGFNQWTNDNYIVDANSGITKNSDDSITIIQASWQEKKNRLPVFLTNMAWHVEFDCETISITNSASFKVSANYTDGTNPQIKTVYLTSVGYKQHCVCDSFNSSKTLSSISFGGWSYQGTVKLTNICVNLVDSPKNGTYEPYTKHSYPLDDSLTLRGIPKLDVNNNLYYDGDTYEADGMVTRRYGVVDLGTLNYSKTTSGLFSTSSLLSLIKSNPNSNVATGLLLSNIYTEISSTAITGPSETNPSPNLVMAENSAGIMYFNNTSYTDVAAFKTAMSGVYLVYPLATPTTETAEPFAETQVCDRYGTEEYVHTGLIPVGHKTKYYDDLKGKIEGLPWNFSSLIAHTETSLIASRNYTAGSYFIKDNVLYKTVTAIASGGAINIGTNVIATTIMQEILALS